MAQGFNRNVTQSFGGGFGQAEGSSNSEIGTILKGVGELYEISQQESQKKRQSDLMGEVQTLVQKRDSALQQRDSPSERKKIQFKFQTDVNSIGLNPDEKDFALRYASELQGGNVSATTRAAVAEQSKTIASRIERALSDPLGMSLASKNIRLNRGDTKEREAFLLKYDEALVRQEKLKIAQQKLESSEGKGARLAFSDWTSELSGVFSQATGSFKALASTVRDLPTAERAAAYTRVKNDLSTGLDMFKQKIQTSASRVRPRLSKQEASEFDKEVEFQLNYIDSTIKGLDKWEDDQIGQLSQYMDIMKTELGIEAIQSAENIFRFREAAGDQAANAIINGLIQDPSILNIVKGKITPELLSGIGITQGQSNAMQFKQQISLFEGKSILDIDPDRREEAAQGHWLLSGKLIKDGSLLQANDATKKSAFNNLTVVLDLAQEGADISQMDRANDLLNHPNFKKFYGELDSTDKKILGRYVIAFNRDVMQDRNIGLVRKLGNYEQVTYDSSTGKFEFKAKPLPKSTGRGVGSSSSFTGGARTAEITTQRDNKDAERLVRKANLSLEKMHEYSQEDDFLRGKSQKEVSDFIYSTTILKAGGRLDREVKVKGTLTQFDQTDIEAQESGLNREEFLRLRDVDESLGKMEKVARDIVQTMNLNIQDPDVLQQVEKKLGSLNKGNQDVDTSDMDDEEFEEYLKQREKELRAQRGTQRGK